VSASRRRPRPPPADATGEAALRGSVVFVHGLWLSGAESFLLGRRLALHGWRLRVLPYSSFVESPDRVARRCAHYARLVARRTAKPVHLVGHSLGGLLIHRMFAQGLLAPDPFSGDFCRVVFLGSPASGTRSARALATWRYGRSLLGLAGTAELLDERERRWDFPARLGVIAGDRPQGLGRLLANFDGPNDGTVAVSETRLPGMSEHIVLPVTHTGLLLAPSVAMRIATFLETGRFAPG
jgi:pimeloyl-ACP methyl ester carboxylesterase